MIKVKIFQIKKVTKVFDEELSGEPLLIKWAHQGAGFKFIKIFGSVTKDDFL